MNWALWVPIALSAVSITVTSILAFRKAGREETQEIRDEAKELERRFEDCKNRLAELETHVSQLVRENVLLTSDVAKIQQRRRGRA